MTVKIAAAAGLLAASGLLAACDPEPGTPEWCGMMKEKPAGDWTANEAAEFTKSCAMEDLNEGIQNLLDQGGDAN
jgi:hypothetical protein